MTVPTPRPILQAAITAVHLACGLIFIFAGANGLPLVMPPGAVLAIGIVWLFPVYASARLAWEMWRFKRALRDLAEAQAAKDAAP